MSGGKEEVGLGEVGMEMGGGGCEVGVVGDERGNGVFVGGDLV